MVSVESVNTLLCLCCFFVAGTANPWDKVKAVLIDAIEEKVFPGCVAAAGSGNGKLFFSFELGNYTYGEPAPVHSGPVTKNTRYDLASLTKVIATTTSIAILYEKGFLHLQDKLSSDWLLGNEFGVHNKENITVLDCLLHEAGFPPDPIPQFWDPEFGCAGAPLPIPINFACSEDIKQAIYDIKLTHKPSTKYVYSDVSMMALMYVIGKVASEKGLISEDDWRRECLLWGTRKQGLAWQCHYEAFLVKHVLSGVKNPLKIGFLPPQSAWGECAPTALPQSEGMEAILQGVVEDGNAYMMGGIAGHAGLFSTLDEVVKFTRAFMTGKIVNETTLSLFTKQFNRTESSRALGWDTNFSTIGTGTCGALSINTFTHTGYTGTQICVDITRDVFTILLTNRVFPIDDSKSPISSIRRNFSSKIVEVMQSH